MAWESLRAGCYKLPPRRWLFEILPAHQLGTHNMETVGPRTDRAGSGADPMTRLKRLIEMQEEKSASSGERVGDSNDSMWDNFNAWNNWSAWNNWPNS
jgi:hypothetical protein